MKRGQQKGIIIMALALCLILMLMIGGSIAYLYDRANPLTNHLTFIGGSEDSSLQAVLEEVWNPAEGLDLKPGDVVIKEVSIKNISTMEMGEWAAIQVIYEKLDPAGEATVMTNAEVEKLLAVMEIDFDTENWSRESAAAENSNFGRYIYNTPLANDESSTGLFTTVKISTDANNHHFADIYAFAPGGINLRLEGAVVQSQGLTRAEAETELVALLPAQ